MRRFNTFLLFAMLALISGMGNLFANAPTVQSKNIAFSGTSSSGMNLTWTRGNGARRIVVAYDITANGAVNWGAVRTALGSTTTEFTDFDGEYDNVAIENITGFANYKVVDKMVGAAKTSVITGLTPTHNYEFHVFEYNLTAGGVAEYYTAAGTSYNPRAKATLAAALVPPSIFAAETLTPLTAIISWTVVPGMSGYIIDVRNQSTSVILVNYDYLDITDATEWMIEGLTANTDYEYRVRSYNSNGAVSEPTVWRSFTTDVLGAAPTVSSVVATPSVLNKAGSTFSIAVTFDKAMNPVNVGTITFDQDVSGTLTFSVGSWNAANTVYTAVYTVTGASNDNLTGLDVTIPVNFTSSENVALGAPSTVNNVFDIDRLLPTITGVAVNGGNGTQNGPHNSATGSVTFDVTFNESVTVSGTPRIALVHDATTGSATRYATYTSGSPGSTLLFTYSVVAGDDASGLTINGGASAGVIDLNSGSLTDANGNALTNTSLTTTGDAFDGANAIVVDGVLPEISSIQYFIDINDNNIYNNGVDTDISSPFYLNEASTAHKLGMYITFSEDMGVTEPTITFDPAVASTLAIDNGNSVWTDVTHYTALYTISDGNVTQADIDVNITLGADVAGNVMAADNNADQFSIDMVPPTVTVTRNAITNGSNYRTNDNTVSFDVAFSEAIITANLSAADDFTLDLAAGPPTSTGQTLVADGGSSTTDFTYNVNGVAADGTVNLTVINNGSSPITDAAGNPIAAATTAADGVFTIDNTAPTVVITRNTPLKGTLGSFITTDNSVSFGINFSEEVMNFTEADITRNLTGVTSNVLGAITAVDAPNGDYTQTVSNIAGDGTLGITLSNAAFTDLAGNAIAANGQEVSATFAIDNTPLAVASSGAVTKSADANPKIYYFTVTYNGGTYDTDNSGTWAGLNSDGSDFSLSFDAGAYGTATAANITSVKANGENEAVSAVNANSGDATVTVFYTVTGTASGTETITLAPATDAIYDNAGNATPTSVTVQKSLKDETAPVVSVIQDGGASQVKFGNSVTITFYVTEYCGITNAPVVQVWNSANGAQVGADAVIVGDKVLQSPGVYAYTYTYTVPNVDEANVRIKVTATDDATLTHTLYMLSAFSIDNTPPTQAAVTFTAQTNNVVANKYNATNDGVQLGIPLANDLTLIGGTYKLQYRTKATNTFGGGDLWTDVSTTVPAITTQSISSGHQNTTRTLNLTDAQFTALVVEDNYIQFRAVTTDVASNSVDGDASASILRDETAPALTPVSIVSSNAVNTLARTGNTITLSFTAASDINSPTVAIKSNAVNMTNAEVIGGGPTAWTASVLVDAADQSGAVTFTIDYTDVIGNPGTQVVAVTDASSVTLDNTAPADAQISSVTTVTAPVVAGYWNASNTALTIVVPVANDATLDNGTIQLQASTDNFVTPLELGSAHTILEADRTEGTYTFTIDATIADAPVGFEELAGFANSNIYKFRAVVTDKAGNATNGTAAVTTITVDQTAPAECTIASRTSVTGTVVANYFNSTNDAVSVTVNIPNDATLDGGKATLQARVGANGFVNVGQVEVAIAGGEVNSTKVLTVSKTGTVNTDLDELTGWANTGVNVDFQVVLADIAGNATTGTTFGTPLAVDMVAPTAPTSVVLNGGNVINATNQTAVSLSFAHLLASETDIATYSVSINDADGGTPAITDNDVAIAASPIERTAGTAFDLTALTDGTDAIVASVTLKDAAGNVSTAGTNAGLTKNANAATVSSVTVTNDNGTYGIGDVVTVRVTFNKVIAFENGDGDIRLELETGATDRFATKSADQLIGAALNYLDLAYTVQENDVAADLDYKLTTSLAFSGTASITDVDGNPVTVLTLPAVGGASSIAGQKAIVIDGVKPTFALQYYYDASMLNNPAADNPVFNAGTSVYLKITSDKPLAANPTVTIESQGTENDKTAVATEYLSDTEFYYYRTFALDASTNGTVKETITIAGQDQSGNNVTAVSSDPAAAAPNYVTSNATKLGRIDCSAPTFTLTYYTNNDYTTGLVADDARLKAGTYYVKVVASEALASAPKLAFTTANATNTKSNQNTVLNGGLGANTYTYQRVIAQDNADNGTVAEIAKVTGMDLAGNNVTIANPNAIPTNAAAQTIYIDTKAPAIAGGTITSPTSATFWKDGVGKSISWTTGDITDEGGLASANPVHFEIEYTDGGGWSTAYQGANSSPQAYELNSASANSTTAQVRLTVTDAAGNISTLLSDEFTIDNTAATVTTLTNTTSIGANRYAKTGETITVNFTAAEPVSISAATIGGETLTAVPDAGFNGTYTFTYTTDGDETEGLQALSIATTDRAGNTATFTHADLTGGSLQIIFDKTVPVIAADIITAPIVSTIWNQGAKDITWTFGSITDATAGLTATPITLEYWDGDSWEPIATGEANDGTYSWAVPNINLATAKVRITAVDNAGNTNSQESAIFKIDNAGPAVALTNDISGRTEVKNGTTVRITATFTDAAGTAIQETPVPTISINDGAAGPDIATDMVKTSNTVWYYDWVVLVGDYATYTVTVAGADIAGNASAAATGVTTYTVDNTAPTVAVANSITGRTCVRSADNTITLTATFTEANTIATGASVPKISIDYSVSADVVDAAMTVDGGNPKVYTYAWTVPATDETATFTITAYDLAGNASTAATGDLVYTVDNSAPTATITRHTPAGANTNADEVTWQIVFDQAVTGFNATDITLTGTLAGTSTKGALTNPGGSTYTFVVDVPNDGNGTIGFSINNEMTDCAGNSLTATSTTTQSVDYTINNGNPTLVSANRGTINVGDNTNKITSLNAVTFTVVFNKEVQNFNNDEISLNTTGTVNTPDIVITSADNITYTVTLGGVTPITGDGALGITLATGNITDLFGNALQAGTTTSTFTIDNTPATISSGSNVGVASNGAEYFVDVTFSNDIYGDNQASTPLVVGDFDVTFVATANGTATAITPIGVKKTTSADYAVAAALTGGETVVRFFFDVVGSASGVETIEIKPVADAIFDVAGNATANTQTTSTKILRDETAPAISAIAVNTITNGQLWLKQGATATITFDMVEVGGITANPVLTVLTAAEGFLGLPTFVSRTGSGTSGDKYVYTYTFPVGAGNYDNVKVQISATDNASLSTNPSLNPAYSIDNTLPTVTIARNGNALTNASTVTFDIDFSEPVVGFDENDITVNHNVTTATKDVITVVDAALGQYRQTVSGITGDGTISLTISNAAFTDRALNAMAANAGPSDAFTIDQTAPIASTVTPSPALINGDDVGNAEFTITVDFDSQMDQTVNPTIAFPVEDPTSIAFASGAWSDGNTYVATYNVTNNGLVLSNIDIRVTAAKDLAGNTMTQKDEANAFSINLDTPTLLSVGIASSSTTNYAKVDDIITLTFTGSTVLKAKPTVTIAGHAINADNVTNTGGNTWAATYTMVTGDDEGVVPFTINFMNVADNPGTQVTAVTNGSSVTFDETNPALAFTAPAADTRTNGSQVLTYTSTDANLGTNRARITNSTPAGTLTAFASGAAISTLSGWANVADGASFTVEIENTDLAGNTATLTRNFVKDITNPSATTLTIASNNILSSGIRATTGNTVTVTLVTPENVSITAQTIDGKAAVANAGADAQHWTITRVMNGTETEAALAFSISLLDVAGNTATVTQANITNASSVTFDKTTPTIATRVLSTNGNAGYAKVGNTITLSLTASEVISQPTVTIAGSAATVSAGPSDTYTATLVVAGGTTEGNAAVSVTAYADLAGNTGTNYATASAGAVIVDVTNPSLAFTAPAVDARTNGTQTIAYSLTETNSSANTQARIVGQNYANFASGAAISTLAGFDALGQGNFTVDLQHTDLAGNVTEVSRQFFKDTQVPTATVTYNKQVLNRADIGVNKFIVTVDFNENMDQTLAPTIAFANPGVSGGLTVGTGAGWTSATQYVAYYNVVDIAQVIEDIDVSVTGARDVALNTQASFSEENAIDLFLVGPTLNPVSIASNNASPTWAKVGNTVTVTFVGSTNLQNVTATINGHDATVNGAGANWTASYTMLDTDSEGLVTFAINFEDLTGNPGAQVTAVSNASSVTFDKTVPVVAITAPIANTKVNNRAITFTVTETNTGTTTASANNATFAAFASGNNANALGGFAGIAEAAFTAKVRHTDLAGNVGEATVELVKDVTAPTISGITLACANNSSVVSFSEPVYGAANGTTGLDMSKFILSRIFSTGSSGANISTKFFPTNPPAGATSGTMSLSWSGTINGTEILNIAAANATAIYDEAGNAMPTAPAAQHHTNIAIAISAHPQNTQVCLNANTTIGVTANGGNSTAYQWQILNGANWENLTNNAPYSNVTTNTLGITNATNELNNKQYRVMISNLCDAGTPSNAATLTVNPHTAITTHPVADVICVGESTNLVVAVSGTAPYQYTWKYYNGTAWVNAANGVPAGASYTNLTTNDMTVSGLTAGSHQFKVSVLGACGVAVESNPATITVNAIPTEIANAVTPESADVCSGSGTNIIIDGTLAELTYQLYDGTNLVGSAVAGTGTVDPLSLPTGALTETTTFTVVATNANSCSANLTTTAQVTVNPAPNADIEEGNAISICAGSNTTLTATEVDAVSYNWFEVGDIATSLGTNRTLSVNTSGTYKVTVTKGGCAVTTATGTTVTVNPLPVPTISGLNAAVTGENIVLETQAGKDNYVWTVNGGTVTAGDINSNTITVNWATTGDKTVTVTYNQNSCSPIAAAQHTVTITNACVAAQVTGQPTATQTVCEGTNVSLTATASGTNLVYTWYKEAGVIDTEVGTGSTLNLNAIAVAQAGQYYARITNGCSNVTTNLATINVTAKVAPSVSIALTSGTNPICAGGSVTFTATPINGGTPSYQWKVNGFNVGTGLSTYTYIPQNNDEVTVVMTSSISCVTTSTATSNSITMTVNPLPTVASASVTPTSVCGSGQVTFSATPSAGSIVWYDAPTGGNIVANVTGITINSTTTYYAQAVNNGCASAARTTVTATVNPLPTVASASVTPTSVCGSGQVTFSATPSAGSIVWYDAPTGGNIVANVTGITINSTTTYYAQAVNNGCPSAARTSVTATVNPLPTPTISGANSVSVNSPIALTTQVGMTGYSWTANGGGVVTNGNTNAASITWNSTGTYTVTVTYTNANGCSASSANYQVEVTPGCASIAITGQPQSNTVCAGTNISFNVTATGTAPITYTWYKIGTPNTVVGGNSATLTIINPQVGDAGIYFVVIDNECTTNPGVQSANVQLTVTTPVLPTVSIVSNDLDNTICPGNQVTFTATAGSLGGGTVAYQWNVNNNPVNGATNSTYTTTTLADNDAVTCTITITGGCVTTASVTSTGITTAVNALTAVTNPGNTAVGVGSNATFTVTGTNVSSYQWQVNTGSGWTNVANVAPYSGATTNTLTITAATTEMSGNTYQVVTTGQCSNPTSAPATLTVSLQAPTTQASNINWTSAAFNSLGLSWTNGNGTGRLLVGKAGASSIPTLELPVDNTLYTSGANTNYDNAMIYAGAGIGTTTGIGTRALVVGNVNAVTIDGLTANTRYCFRLFEYNHSGSNIIYNKTLLTNTSRSRYTPLKDGIIDIEQLGEGSIMTLSPIHPNPAKDKVALNFDMKENAVVRISLFNLQGIEVFNLDANNYSVGQHTIEVPLTDLPSGAYTFVIGSGDEVIVESIVVVK